jgi:hypothetical protein
VVGASANFVFIIYTVCSYLFYSGHLAAFILHVLLPLNIIRMRQMIMWLIKCMNLQVILQSTDAYMGKVFKKEITRFKG